MTAQGPSSERRTHAYTRVADDLRQLAAQAPPGGLRLPTDAELSLRHKVSRQTVRRAYQELVAEGLVNRTPGKGTFTSDGVKYARSFATIDDLMALAEDTEMEVAKPLRLTGGSARARADLGAGQVMEVWIRRLHYGEAFSLTIISFPIPLGQRLKRTFLGREGSRSRATALALLESALGRPIHDAVQEITVASVPLEIANLIELPTGQAALRIDRVYRDADGNPVESTINYFNPGRYTYRLHLGRAGPRH